MLFVEIKAIKKDIQLHEITNESTVKAIKIAARERNDMIVRRRVETIDLIGLQSMYHRKCRASFVNDSNIRSANRPGGDANETVLYDDPFQEAFNEVVEEINDDLLQGKKAFF